MSLENTDLDEERDDVRPHKYLGDSCRTQQQMPLLSYPSRNLGEDCVVAGYERGRRERDEEI
jgi:hypothetical protein